MAYIVLGGWLFYIDLPDPKELDDRVALTVAETERYYTEQDAKK